MEIDRPFTPSMLSKIVYDGSKPASFVQAVHSLEALAEVKVSRERVQRGTNRVEIEMKSSVGRGKK